MNKNKIISSVAISAVMMAAALGVSAQDSAMASAPHAVGSTLEVHINDSGKVLVRGAKVNSVSGNTINASTIFGSLVMPWNVNVTTGTTIMVKRFGASLALSDIQAGDYISFAGVLDTGASQATVKASSVKDWSLQIGESSFSGTVASVNAGANTFVLTSTSRGDITVNVSSSTKIMKGDSQIAFADIKAGDRITKTSGLYDNASKTLTASMVTVHVNEGLLEKRLFQGTLKSISGTSAPTTLVLTVGDTDFTVNVPANISVLNKTWLGTSLSNFQAGDTVRVYGAVEVNNTSTIDASVVRDASR